MLERFSTRPLELIIAGSVFLLIASLWLGALLWWVARRRQESQRLQERLGLEPVSGATDSDTRELHLWRDGREATTRVPGARERLSPLHRLEQLCHDAGWATPAPAVMMYLLALAGTVFLLGTLLTGWPLVGLAGLAVVLVAFWAVLKKRVQSRTTLFERQFIDAMDLAARSLRVGHPLAGAFRLIAEEIAAPVGPLFAEIHQRQSMGTSLETAVRQAAERSRHEDLKLFATSVVIQLRSGGNLADMMERLGAVIRDRIRLGRRVRILTAQTQFSKYVLIALPILLFIVLNLINPQYMAPLYSTFLGYLMLAYAGASMLVGTWVMSRMAVLKY